MPQHTYTGNCWATVFPDCDCNRGTCRGRDKVGCPSRAFPLCDVCHDHDEPRGACEECLPCEACEAEEKATR